MYIAPPSGMGFLNAVTGSVDTIDKTIYEDEWTPETEPGYPDSYYKQGESGIPMMYIYLAISAILIYFLVKRYGK